MEPGAHTTYIAWRLLASGSGARPVLSVAILANGRDHHGETWIPGFAPEIAAKGVQLTMHVQDRFALLEIFDGDPPHTPGGAPARAWSSACVLEAWWRLERAKRTGEPHRNSPIC